jgi:glutathione S-transferase
VNRYSPVGKVPVLVDGDVVVWDSLAIVEYLAEKFPDQQLWPVDRKARALARSICAEMHAGFRDMRETLVMNCERTFATPLLPVKVRKDIDRIVFMWSDARARFGAAGPFLFGAFSIADACFAPVALRFVTYGIELPEVCRHYVETISGLPAMREWIAGAVSEHDFVSEDEPYRAGPG